MNILSVVASVAIVTVLSVAGASANPVVTKGDTNLRKSPGTDSPVLTLIPKGTSVEVGKCSNGWCQVSVNGQDGYVFAPNVGMAPPRRMARGPVGEEEIVEEDYGPPPGYVVGPPVYYGYGPYYGYYGGWGYRGGWGRRW